MQDMVEEKKYEIIKAQTVQSTNCRANFFHVFSPLDFSWLTDAEHTRRDSILIL